MNREIKFRVWDSEKKRMSKPISIGDYIVIWSDGDMDMPIQFASAKSERFLSFNSQAYRIRME